VTITATAALATIGGLTFEATAGGAADESSLTVQVNVNVTDTVRALEALGFAGVVSPPSASSPNCAASATGSVRLFLIRHPCNAYAGRRLTIHRQGTAALVAISWVEMPTAALARQYKATADVPNTGNPPGERGFSGLCYASGQRGTKVWTEQVKPFGYVPVATERWILQAAAPRKLTAGYLLKHCVG
jgi:hypothetical protein